MGKVSESKSTNGHHMTSKRIADSVKKPKKNYRHLQLVTKFKAEKKKEEKQRKDYDDDDQTDQERVDSSEQDCYMNRLEAACFCSSLEWETSHYSTRTDSSPRVNSTYPRNSESWQSDAAQTTLEKLPTAVNQRDVPADPQVTVMEMNKNVDNKNASKPKKLKLSSSLAGRAESKSNKSWRKLKAKYSQQKKRSDRPFASAVRSVSNRSGVPTVTIGIVPPTSCQPSTVPYLPSALPLPSSAAPIPALNFGRYSRGARRTDSGSLASVSSLLTNMSLDRSMRREAGAWNSPDSFVNDSFGSYKERNGQGGGLYTDFSQDWADPRGTPPYMNRTAANSNSYRWPSDQQKWQQGGSRNWHGGGGPQGRYWNGNFRGGQMQGRFSHQGWSSWGPDDHDWPRESDFLRPQSAESGNQTRPSRSHTHWDQAFTERGAQNNQWQNLTKHFGSSHFHREGPNGQELSDGSHAPQADSSGLEDSGSSGGGRKRPRSFDRGSQLSKSSRAERFTSRYYDGYSPNSGRALSVSDLNTPEVQKPDSFSKQGKAQKSQTMVAKGSKSVNGSGVKTGGSGSKKKQTASKHKMAPSSSVSGPKAADGVSKTSETDEANPGEGILERAERICKELREKRKAVPSRANLSAQRVGALRSVVLNTSVRRFNLAHKSFLKGYMSDSNSTMNKPTSGDMTADSATQKKHVSSSVNSDMEQSTMSQGSTATSADSGADTATSSSTKSSQLQGSDIERIRQSIESSVMAEKRARRTSVRERSLSGSRSPAVSVSSTAVHSAAASSAIAGTSPHASKPPLPLSKDALAKMVNAPRSRTQRLQLARILRQHSATTIIRPRRIQLDGLYDNDDGDSIGDVLKNISGLEEIGECAELSKIKLEDLTYEDKLQIAQMIEEADWTNRNSSTDVMELGEQRSVQRSSRPPHPITISSSERINQGPESSGANPRSASADRLQALSPSPSRPLSLDDLNTEDRSRQEDSADIVSLHPGSADVCPSSSTVTTLRSASPARAALEHSSSPRPSRTCSQSPGRSGGAGDSLDLPSTSDAVDTSTYQASGDALTEHTSRQAVLTPMDISDPPASSNPAGRSSSQEAGVLYEVMGLCKRQDSILSEMRSIDNELCDMYKSLIEVVARMSGLQRRRVQLQTEGEQLSQRRNDLLHGLYPNTAVSLDKGPLSSAQEERQQRVPSDSDANPSSMPLATDGSVQSSRRSSVVEMSDQASSGPAVVLPSWLRPPSSSRSVSQDREGSRQETTPSASDHRSDICLLGSVSSSVGTTLSQSTSLNNSVDSVREVAPRQLSAPSAKRSSSDVGERAGRVMLSITGAVDSSVDREGAVSSVSSVSTEASHSVVKNRMGADSSSGIGSSVSAHSNFRKSLSSPLSDSGSHQNLSSTPSSQEEHSKLAQPPESSRIVIHSFSSSKPSNIKNTSSPNVNQPKSPGVSVAYLGALTSDLVQQIVRNLPLTSQLGEVNKPSMYVVRQENSAMDIPSENRSQDAGTKSTSADNFVAQPRTRTTSAHSVSSDLSSGEHTLTASIPPLKLCEDSDKAGSKTGTPRSESDSLSVTSGTSLGEQIKLFSERNSFSQETASSLSTLPCVTTNQGEDGTATSKSVQEMRDCSVLLERLDMDSITIIPESWRVEEEMDRRRKRKSRKDRDQSLQRRRCYVTDSSSGGEDGEITPVGDGYHSVASPTPQPDPSDLLDSVEKMEADCGPEEEDLNSTLVESIEQPPSDEEVGSPQAANPTPRTVSPSRLKLNPENLKAFRANIRLNMSPSPAREASMESTGADQVDVEERVANKEILKISGPSAPVSGLCVHNNLLYACFQRIGVHSYTLTGELSAEYPTADAHCFTITPVGSSSQHYLAVGCADRLTFLSINDQSVVSSLDTVVKVMCVQVVDTTLFAGLDTGAIIVISLTTLQETRRFQASDCPVQCMSWTREGSTRLLTVASQDANIHVIDAGSGLPVRIISGHTKTAFSLCMVDHIVLSGSGDRKVMAHNVHNAALVWELHDHKGIITSICVDNGLLFTAGYDKIIRCYDLKSRKLLHLMYGAGKCVIMKMAIHNSFLYTGNRDGEIEAIDLRDMGSFACECVSCSMVYGLQEHLWHHLVTDHLLPNTQAMRCPWSDCAVVLDTRSSPEKAGEHLRQHINVSH